MMLSFLLLRNRITVNWKQFKNRLQNLCLVLPTLFHLSLNTNIAIWNARRHNYVTLSHTVLLGKVLAIIQLVKVPCTVA